MNFNASSDKSENLHFNVLLWLKVYYVWVKKVQRVMCHNTGEELWRRTKFEEELTSAFENDMRYFTNFDPTLKSLKIYLLIGSFWPKYKMLS